VEAWELAAIAFALLAFASVSRRLDRSIPTPASVAGGVATVGATAAAEKPLNRPDSDKDD
jgi:hypothetical protein